MNRLHRLHRLLDRLRRFRRLHEEVIPPFLVEMADLEWQRFATHLMTPWYMNLLTTRRQAFVSGFAVGATFGARAPIKVATTIATHWTRRAWTHPAPNTRPDHNPN